MNARIADSSWVVRVVLIIGLTLFCFPGIGTCAEETPGKEPEKVQESLTPSLVAPSAQVDQTALNRRLRTARKDLDAFRDFAASFRSNGDTVTLTQLQAPVDVYLVKHVDNLLTQVDEYSTLETTRLAAEAMFNKARLLICLNREEAARNVVAEIKKRFSSYPKITVDLAGKTTTLDEGLRILDEESAAAAKAGKMQEER